MIKDFFLALSLEFFFVTLRQLYIRRNILLFSGISKFRFHFYAAFLNWLRNAFSRAEIFDFFITFKVKPAGNCIHVRENTGKGKNVSRKNISKEKLAKGKLIFFCLSSFCAFFHARNSHRAPEEILTFCQKGNGKKKRNEKKVVIHFLFFYGSLSKSRGGDWWHSFVSFFKSR